MATITITGFSVTNTQLADGTCKLRIYANKDFVTSGGQTVLRAGVGSSDFYKQVSCTITSNVISASSFTVDSTSDGVYAGAEPSFHFALFTDAGVYIESPHKKIKVGTTTPITWATLVDENTGSPVATTSASASKSYVDSEISSLVSVATKATDAIYGVGKLSVAAVTPADPIVVGDNDKRLEDSLENYASLSAAISAAGSTPTVFTMPVSVTVSTAITVPANVYIRPSRGAVFTKSGSGTLTFSGHGLIGAGRFNLFSSFSSGNVKWNGALPEEFYPEWFGAVGDSTTDDLAAFDKLIAAFNYEHTGVGLITVQRISLAAGKKYKFSDTWHIDVPVHLYGAGSNNGSELRFAANKTGIVLHSYNSKTGSNDNKRSDYSILENFRIFGNNGSVPASAITTTHTVDVSGLVMTATAGTSFTAATGYLKGTTLTTNGFPYVLDTLDSTTQITIRKPKVKFYTTTPGATQLLLTLDYYALVPTDGAWDGQTITIDGNNYTIASTDVSSPHQRINLTSKISTSSTWGEIQAVGTLSDGAMRPSIYHGIDLRTHAEVRDVYVYAFPGDGIRSATSASIGVANSNLSRIDLCTLSSCSGSGLFFQGNDANQINIINNNCQINGGFGIWEHSFLGNAYFGNHTASNWSGSRDGESGGVNASAWVGEYAEADQVPETYGGQHTTFGGVNAAGLQAASGGAHLTAGNGRWISKVFAHVREVSSLDTKAVTFSNYSTLANTLLGWGAGEEVVNTGEGLPITNAVHPAYKLRYNDPSLGIPVGWYGLEYKIDTSGSAGVNPMMFSGSRSAEGGGKVSFPNGFYFGTHSTTRRVWRPTTGTPTFGTVGLGAILWNNDTAVNVTAPAGWIATVAGGINVSAKTFTSAVPTAVSSFTVETTGASPSLLANSSGLSTGDIIRVSSSGTLPFNLSAGVDYYVYKIDSTHFALATSLVNATQAAPVLIHIPDTGTGTHTVIPYGNIFTTATNNFDNEVIGQFTTSGTLPTGLSLATNYWVKVLSATTFKVASSLANLQAGTFIAVTDNGTGTHTFTPNSATLTAFYLNPSNAAPGAIGGTTPAAGTFTTLTGTTVDGTIGSVTPAAITGTTVTANTSVTSAGSIKSSSATGGVGYATGAGGAITQDTNRTTGVTLNKVCGSITLVSAAGTASWQTFTVTNSTVAVTDTVKVCQKSGTDLNMIHVTAVGAGSFNISFATTGGTTTEQPVFNFAVIKGVAS